MIGHTDLLGYSAENYANSPVCTTIERGIYPTQAERLESEKKCHTKP
jgi:hypothetical protein